MTPRERTGVFPGVAFLTWGLKKAAGLQEEMAGRSELVSGFRTLGNGGGAIALREWGQHQLV